MMLMASQRALHTSAYGQVLDTTKKLNEQSGLLGPSEYGKPYKPIEINFIKSQKYRKNLIASLKAGELHQRPQTSIKALIK